MRLLMRAAAFAAALMTFVLPALGQNPGKTTGKTTGRTTGKTSAQPPGVAWVQSPANKQLWLPDQSLTPGATLEVTKDDVCRKGYAKTARNVPDSEKKAVYRAYGMTPNIAPCPCEIDHLDSLELGGSNVQSNLWPEPYYLNVNGREMGAHQKDLAEDATHKAVCEGRISLEGAQKQIAADWTVLYRRFVAPEFPPYNGPPKSKAKAKPGKCI